MSVKAGLVIEVIWYDVDLLEVQVSGSNGRFVGVTDCYASHSVGEEFAGAIAGFPTSGDDSREFSFGADAASHAGGGCQLRLSCIDNAGHCLAHLTIRSPMDVRGANGEDEVRLVFPFEPAALDDFVRELRALQASIGSVAILGQAT
jgi:hypothetical protein